MLKKLNVLYWMILIISVHASGSRVAHTPTEVLKLLFRGDFRVEIYI